MWKWTENWLIKLLHSFEVHSNESACRKSGRLGLDQVFSYDTFYAKHRYLQVPQVMLRIFQKAGKHKLSWIYAHYLPLALSDTIVPVKSYQFQTSTPILKLCQMLIYLCLPPAIYFFPVEILCCHFMNISFLPKNSANWISWDSHSHCDLNYIPA